MPIFFRGKPYSALKSHFEGTHRVRSPQETWEKIASCAPQIGVTRIADVTGLDRVGIPIILVFRPASRTLVTSSGKGFDLISAKVSGLMESMELFCAEQIEFTSFRMSYNQVAEKMVTVPFSLIPKKKESLFHPDWQEKWTLGWDLCAQQEVALPLLNVGLDFRTSDNEAPNITQLVKTSNGLASGNHLLEAVASGLYEVIERDALYCHQILKNHELDPPIVNLDSIPYKKVKELIHKFRCAEISPVLYNCTVDTEVPVFMVKLYDRQLLWFPLSSGSGAHLDPEVAMIRAFTEAAQSRFAIIAGSRDDIFNPHFELDKKEKTSLPSDDFPDAEDASLYSSCATSSFEEDVQILLDKLQKVGLSQVIVFDLTTALSKFNISTQQLGISVVRVVVPGLEDADLVLQGRAKDFILHRFASQFPVLI